MTQPVSTLRYLDTSGVPLLAARVVLGVMFLAVGLLKIQAPSDFLRALRQYDLLPERPPYLNVTAVVVPCVEVTCGAFLLLGIGVRGAAFTLLVMLMTFTTALVLRARSEQRGQKFCDVKFDCGCGTGVMRICDKLVENGALIVLAMAALGSQTRRWCLSHVFWRRELRSPRSCPRCGYAWFGLMETECPDCGAPRVPPPPSAAARLAPRMG